MNKTVYALHGYRIPQNTWDEIRYQVFGIFLTKQAAHDYATEKLITSHVNFNIVETFLEDTASKYLEDEIVSLETTIKDMEKPSST